KPALRIDRRRASANLQDARLVHQRGLAALRALAGALPVPAPVAAGHYPMNPMMLPASAPASALAGERLRWGEVGLQLRSAVAWREQRLTRGVGVYLSLYADEIDQRAARFWAAHQDGDPAQAA